MASVLAFDSDLSSPWLVAQAHHEALTDYVSELPSLFAQHSTQMRLRERNLQKNLLRDPHLSKEDREIVNYKFRDSIETYNHRLRQVIFSPAIIAVVSCFEHYIRIGYKISIDDSKIIGLSNWQSALLKKHENIAELFPQDLDFILAARHVISHLNGWFCDYDFKEPCEEQFLRWAKRRNFQIDGLGVLVADIDSVDHCFNALVPFFEKLPAIIGDGSPLA